jgi:hypothetical protein
MDFRSKRSEDRGRKSGAGSQIQAVGRQLAATDGGRKILKQSPVKCLPKRDVFNMVLISVAKAYADLNFKDISGHDREYMVNELTDNIIKHYPGIRLSEIPDAIWLGARGKYGEYFGLSVVTFEGFIEKYLLSEKRVSMVKELPPDDEPKTAPDLQIQFNTFKEVTLQALQRKAACNDIEVIASTVYNFLDRIKLITFTAAEKYDMLADATRELIGELKFKLTLALPTERAAIKKDLEAYTLAITTHAALNERLYSLAKLRAKKLALGAFLNNVLLEGMDLEVLVENKRGLFLEE